jgi:hypothetical protein
LHHFKLQRPDGGQQRRLGRGVAQLQHLDDAFLQQLVQAGAKLFVLGRVGIVQPGKRPPA